MSSAALCKESENPENKFTDVFLYKLEKHRKIYAWKIRLCYDQERADLGLMLLYDLI